MALGLLAGLTTACDTGPADSPDLPNDGYLELNFSAPETRTDLNDAGAGNFSEGDRIGLYIGNGSKIEYRELTYRSGVWEPRLLRSDFGEGELTLAAHYPVRNTSAEEPARTTITLEDDQSGDGFAASDLLTARKVLAAGVNRADMLFAHALHRLRIEFSGSGASEVSGVKLRSRMEGSADLLTGAVTATEGSFGWITPRKSADGSYEAVILPQSAEALRGEEGLLKFTTTNGEHLYKAPATLNGEALTAFAAGQQLTLKLTLKGSSDSENPVDKNWANKKVWVYGITAPVWEEGHPEWKQIFAPHYLCYYLALKDEYGLFDCNKTDPTNRNNIDGNMCWAAADSNLLHWWFAQNMDYIKRYGDRYKGPSYEYPQKKAQESDIFQCFIDSFVNQGGFGEPGINWFISGDPPSGPARTDPYNDAGYFKEVFGEVRLGLDFNGMGVTSFNTTIRNALANRQAIAISTGTASSGHLMTVWGAEFDANGLVSYLYMVDNNDRDSYESDGIGVMRFPIVYGEYDDGFGTYVGYLTGYDGDEDGQIDTGKPINIKRLTTIDLGREQWEAFFRQHPEL